MNRNETNQSTRWVFLAAMLSLGTIASSQQAPSMAAPPVAPVVPATAPLTDAQLQTLVAPVALYPDALIAQILPASTYPLQVVMASRFLQANPNPTEAAIDAQNLEPCIKAVLHYPPVLAKLNGQLDWTQSLGVAFLNQQADVMNAVQELRQRARNAGVLNSTPQQQVVSDDGDIEIVPANPDQMYVPDYDAMSIFDANLGTSITFGMGYPEGFWLGNNIDWHHRWVADGGGWHHGWANPIGNPRSGEEQPLTRPWARNSAQALPVRTPSASKEAERHAGPGYETPAAKRPAPAAFGGYQSKADVERQQTRAQQSRLAVQPARPVPQARPAQAAPAQVFHAEGTGRTVAAESARGNASRAASAGGGGGGGRGGGGGGRR